jgi:hypothetical protein
MGTHRRLRISKNESSEIRGAGLTYVNKGSHCASRPPRRSGTTTAVAATVTLVGATVPCMYMGTMTMLCVGAGVAGRRRRAPGGRFCRRLGLDRRRHDDFYLCILVEDLLGLQASSEKSFYFIFYIRSDTHQGKARTRRSRRWAGKSIIYRLFCFCFRAVR